MLDRRVAPAIHKTDKLIFPGYELYYWDNGTKVCEINMGSQEILKVEIVHVAGRSVEHHHLASRAVSSLIKDGCKDKTSTMIAEEIDYYGSSIKTASNMDFSYTTLYCLTKFSERAINQLYDIYTYPTFPEDEVEKFKHLNIQKLKEELTKNEVITYRQITEEIFGKDHPYGYNSTETDYKNLNRRIILDHYETTYGTDNRFIIISGKINDEVRKSIYNTFGQDNKKSNVKSYVPAQSTSGKKILLTSKNEHQSAIKTGFKLFNRDHVDNAPFFVLNTIFGGYFGSRLMSSIREDLGYTYDIHSSADQMLHDGCFYVSTEAATEYVQPLLREVYHQMNILKQEKVKNKELNMVKNYLMGSFMNMLDGPMNVSSFVKTMLLTGKEPKDFLDFTDQVNAVGGLKIQEMAQKYFNEEDMIEVIVTPEG
jgi:zinc protease